jgi:predicted Zn-dependent protease
MNIQEEKSEMKRNLLQGVGMILLVLFFAACSTVPITGRKQLNMIPASEMLGMSYQQYREFLSTNKVSSNQQQVQTVKAVGARIQHAVEEYFAQKGLTGGLQGYQWEFNVVESNEVNAWCMPGGKVVFYTGILPVTRTEAGIAVVMGHEVAHAVAEHGNERMSQEMLAQLGGMALSEALAKEPEKTRELWSSVYGIGAQYGALLPFSRTQESEADHLGLVFMTMAGYDPAEAVSFWQRMSQGKGGQAPPEFMSTHPADATRIADIQRLLPEMAQYRKK